MYAVANSIQYGNRYPGQGIKAKRRGKGLGGEGIQIGEEVKCSSFAGDMIYGEYPKESTKKATKTTVSVMRLWIPGQYAKSYFYTVKINN